MKKVTLSILFSIFAFSATACGAPGADVIVTPTPEPEDKVSEIVDDALNLVDSTLDFATDILGGDDENSDSTNTDVDTTSGDKIGDIVDTALDLTGEVLDVTIDVVSEIGNNDDDTNDNGRTWQDEAIAVATQIHTALSTHDSALVKSLFSTKIQNISDIDSQIDSFLSNFDGSDFEYEDVTIEKLENDGLGIWEDVETIATFFDVTTNTGKEYDQISIAMIFSSGEDELVGLKSITLIESSGKSAFSLRPLTINFFEDMDGDDLPAEIENAIGTSDTIWDTDGDGIRDVNEFLPSEMLFGGSSTKYVDRLEIAEEYLSRKIETLVMVDSYHLGEEISVYYDYDFDGNGYLSEGEYDMFSQKHGTLPSYRLNY